MKIIKCIVEKVEEELHDADAYISLAITWKEEQPEAAKVFYELSLEEMGHVGKLHDEVTRLIGEYRQETGEPPKDMLTLWSYLHEPFLSIPDIPYNLSNREVS